MYINLIVGTVIKFFLVIFILIPFSIWVGTMISALVSILLMTVSIFAGSSLHKIFVKKSEEKWYAPSYLKDIQALIIQGLLISVYASVIGSFFNWNWLSTVGNVLRSVSLVVLLIDLIVLTTIATIHGKFEILDD